MKERRKEKKDLYIYIYICALMGGKVGGVRRSTVCKQTNKLTNKQTNKEGDEMGWDGITSLT